MSSRDTAQSHAVKLMKQNIRLIVSNITPLAGDPNKDPNQEATVKENINNTYAPVFRKNLQGIAANRQWPSKFWTLWTDFWSAWNDGNGSWTNSLKYAKQLNALFDTVDP
jgi:hypothetical protein